MTRRFALLAMLACLFAASPLAAQEATGSEESAEQAAREQKFCDMLSDSALVGSFTMTHGSGAGPLGAAEALKEDRYQIDKVTKGKGNFFVFEARIQYQGKDQVFKMPVEVQWAGDTPVITMTKILVPGLGTFTARILFYDDHYAGFWSGGDHGGHMFGRIERKEKAETATEEKPAETATDK